MDVIADLAVPLPAIVSSEMLGLPRHDWQQLTSWTHGRSPNYSVTFSTTRCEPPLMCSVVDDMTAYFRARDPYPTSTQ